MKKSLLLLMLLPFYGFTQSTLVSWNNLSQPTNLTNITAQAITTAGGVQVQQESWPSRFQIGNLHNGSSSATINYAKYVEFKVSPNNNYKLTPSQFILTCGNISNDKTRKMQVVVSNDGTNTATLTNNSGNTVINVTSNQQTVTLNFPAGYTILPNKTLSIKVYLYDHSNIWYTNFAIYNPTGSGSVGVEGPVLKGNVESYSSVLLATNDNYTVNINQPTVLNVLSNDVAGNAPVSSINFTQPSNGSVALSANNTLAYTPNNNYIGQDSFTYTATNGTDPSSTATVTLAVQGITPTGALSGTYYVGTGGHFTTITQAVNYLNSNGVSGPVTFLLNNSTYSTAETFPITINQFSGTSVTNKVTFKPAPSKNVRIEAFRDNSYTAVPAVFKINGADNIVFDGSNIANGTTRNLFVTNSSYAGDGGNDYVNRTVFWIASANGSNGSDNVTIKYLQIKQTYKNNPDKFCLGIYAGDNSTGGNNELSVNAAATANTGIKITGNDFVNVKQGVYINGKNSNLTSNVVISQNDLGAEINTETIVQPVYLSNVTAFEVSENLIYKLYRDNTSGNLSAGGIYIANNTNSGVIKNNNLSEIIRTETNDEPFFGIRLSSTNQSSNITVFNNFILNVAGQGNGGPTHNGYGIFIGSGGGYKIYNNTVKLEKNQTSSSRNHSAALFINSGVTGLDVRNNILVNAQTNENTERYAIAVIAPTASTFSQLNYNNYYSTKFIGMYGASITEGGNPYAQTSLSGWISATNGKDAQSKNVNPVFISATDLHISTSSAENADLNDAGTPIASVTKDIDGQIRNTTTPDMGADEFGSIQVPDENSNEGIYCSSSTTWLGENAVPQWSNGVPAIDKDVIFSANYTQSGGTLYACSIFVTGNAEVTFTNQSNAIVEHNVNVAATAKLTFDSSSNLVQNQNTINSGNVTVKRNSGMLKRLDYTMWSSPVSGNQTLQEFSPLTLSNRFYVYDTTTDLYAATSASNTFVKAKGYLIRVPNTFPDSPTVYNGAFKGVPNNGNVYIPLVRESSSNAYNAVGNPYPSPISVTDFIDANIDNIEGTIWMWRKTNNPNASSYCTITKFAYQANSAAGGGANTDVSGNELIFDPFRIDSSEGALLNTGQGFIVKAKNTQNLVFKNNMRRTTNFNYFFRTAATDSDTAGQPEGMDASRMWLNVSNEGGDFAQAVIGYTPIATLDYDNGLDGRALGSGNVSLYTKIEDVKYAIQARPAFDVADIVPLGYKAAVAGTFEIKIDRADGIFADAGQAVYLHDRLLNAIYNLNEGAYSFSTEAGTFDDRFEIMYSIEALGVDVPQVNVKDVIVYRDGKQVKIQSPAVMQSVEIYDLLGRAVYSQNNIDATEFTSAQLNVAQQVAIIKITLDNKQVVSKKIMLN
jgi:hypothetical protein